MVATREVLGKAAVKIQNLLLAEGGDGASRAFLLAGGGGMGGYQPPIPPPASHQLPLLSATQRYR